MNARVDAGMALPSFLLLYNDCVSSKLSMFVVSSLLFSMKNQKKKGNCDSYRDKVEKTVKDVLDGNALSMHDRLEVLGNGLL